jgi:hypothetical protein
MKGAIKYPDAHDLTPLISAMDGRRQILNSMSSSRFARDSPLERDGFENLGSGREGLRFEPLSVAL